MSDSRETIQDLDAGTILVTEGTPGGDLHVLLDGELDVERGGVKLATLTQPGTLIGEMSVLLGRPATATVRVGKPSRVRTISNASAALEKDPRLAMRVAAILATRLDATSALLVDLTHQHGDKPHERGILERIMGALHTFGDDTAEIERIDLFGADAWPRGPM
jgi:CRP/FNR family cyclic AMP-dependent transcriptional regulator